jgi:SPP1 gp7 family putative phage head morphogenesis protein
MKKNNIYIFQNRTDPTNTLTIRNRFASKMRVKFRGLRGVIRKAIIDKDVFGFNTPNISQDYFLPREGAFDFPRSRDKIEAFLQWLREMENRGILEVYFSERFGTSIEEAWTDIFIRNAYQRGIERARNEMIKAGYAVPTLAASGGLVAVFNEPYHVDRVGILYTRTFSELRGITEAMDSQISRVLAEGMARGIGPREIARMLTRTISGPDGDLGLTDILGRFIPAERRALLLARTEVIRAHHAAMIQEFKNWEVEDVYIIAEWITAEDSRVCSKCKSLAQRDNGRGPGIYSLEEIEPLIPAHPQCRCIAIPKDITDERRRENAAS